MNSTGDAAATPEGSASSAELLVLVYEDLRRLAAGKLAQEQGALTLSATALVHEAWLRLEGRKGGRVWNSRRHFYWAAAEAMRRIMVERARAKGRIKRGGGRETVPLEGLEIVAPMPEEQLLAVNDALERLKAEDPVAGEIVSLRCFAGLTWAEIADLTGMSERDLGREWEYARSWLHAKVSADLN